MRRTERVYRSSATLRLSPTELRALTFRPAPPWRPGVRADDVRELLLAVATHLERVYGDLAAVAEENDRLRRALGHRPRRPNSRPYQIPGRLPRDPA